MKTSATSGKKSENVVGMKNNVVRMKISKNIADPDFEDNIDNIEILSIPVISYPSTLFQ